MVPECTNSKILASTGHAFKVDSTALTTSCICKEREREKGRREEERERKERERGRDQ